MPLHHQIFAPTPADQPVPLAPGRFALRWPIARRCLFAAASLAVIFGTVHWIEGGYRPGEIRLPANNVRALPLQIGAWRGEDTELDPRLTVALATDVIVNRRYSRPDGAALSLHAVSWLSDLSFLPHPPEICYENAGWTITGDRVLPLESRGNKLGTGRLLSVELEGQRAYVLYWYQYGSVLFADFEGKRAARRNLWGREIWPPLTKVMIHAAVPHSATAEDRLQDFAASMLEWMNAGSADVPDER